MKRIKIARGIYMVGRLRIIHARNVIWETFDEDDHVDSHFTLGEACAAARARQGEAA